MLPDRVSNPGPLTNESGALPIALRGPAEISYNNTYSKTREKSRRTNKLQTNSFNKLSL